MKKGTRAVGLLLAQEVVERRLFRRVAVAFRKAVLLRLVVNAELGIVRYFDRNF